MTQATTPQATTQTFGGGPTQDRSWKQALLRGARKRCPRCAHGRLFSGYTKTAERCEVCGLDFTGHRADDAPPYFTTLIVGHVTIPIALAVAEIFAPPLWVQFAIWLPALMAMTLWLLPISKGALVGVQWANRMHGFGGSPETADV